MQVAVFRFLEEIPLLLMPLAETIKEFVSFILKGVDLINHTSIIPFTYYQSLRNSYNVYSIMIRSNQNLFKNIKKRKTLKSTCMIYNIYAFQYEDVGKSNRFLGKAASKSFRMQILTVLLV